MKLEIGYTIEGRTFSYKVYYVKYYYDKHGIIR